MNHSDTPMYPSTTDAGNAPPVLTVSALNQRVARMMETQIPLCWISGEISNFTRAASGHWYFTLKDEQAQVRAVMFRGRAQYAAFSPRDGDKVEVRAQVSLYVPRGDFQINVEAIRRAGVGNLYEAFLRLKEKLAAQGLFAPQNKRPLPFFARRIGILTSPQAAALRDVLTTFARRSPHLELLLYPVPVQGAGAAEKIAAMLALANQRAECDLLILCRGGGSIEDLWCFNEEVLAHAIAASRLPVISAVGHETDFTIADFVADLRAPTPTAACELAARASSDWQQSLAQLRQALQRAMQRSLQQRAQQLDVLSHQLQNPGQRLAREALRLKGLQRGLQHALHMQLQQAKHRLQQARLRPPAARVEAERQRLAHLQQRLQQALQTQQQSARHRLQQSAARLLTPDLRPAHALLQHRAQRLQQIQRHLQQQRRAQLNALAAQLELLNPQRTLERGYAIASLPDGGVVRAPQQLQGQTRLHLQTAGGKAELEIKLAKQQ